MRHLLLVILFAAVFLSGCVDQGDTTTSSNVGLSRTLSYDLKQVAPSTPVTFILSVKNLASEDANFISTELTNLTGWRIENNLQEIDEILSNDVYKFSWIAYSPQTPNRTFTAVADLFYLMETNANLNIRVYNGEYLEILKPEERKTIVEKSALLSSEISKSTPLSVAISLKQPFILTEDSGDFPFVIEVKNTGPGTPYNDNAGYLPGERDKNHFRFSYATNAELSCDFEDGDLVGLVNRSKSIVCRLNAEKDEVGNYTDFPIDFTIAYTYLDKTSTKIEVK